MSHIIYRYYPYPYFGIPAGKGEGLGLKEAKQRHAWIDAEFPDPEKKDRFIENRAESERKDRFMQAYMECELQDDHDKE